jgi:probable phosphoglycerate mutase
MAADGQQEAKRTRVAARVLEDDRLLAVRRARWPCFVLPHRTSEQDRGRLAELSRSAIFGLKSMLRAEGRIPWNSEVDLFLAPREVPIYPYLPDGVSRLVFEDVSELVHFAEAAAADTETRMGLVTHAAESALGEGASSSVHALVSATIEEASASGLATRHAVRICLEAVLARDAQNPASLAAQLHFEVNGHDQLTTEAKWHRGTFHGSAVQRVLDALAVEDLSALALNVMSVLLFSRTLCDEALLEWEGLYVEADIQPTPALAPLLAWVRRPVEEEVQEETQASAPPPPPPLPDAAAAASTIAVGRSSSPSSSAAPAASARPEWRRLQVDPACRWEATSASPVLNVRLGDGAEAVVVLDGLCDEETRAELLSLMTGGAPAAAAPPNALWERTTCDGAGLPCSWGMQPDLLAQLEQAPPPAVVEVQSRLSRLYPEYEIVHMPSVDGGGGGGGRFRCTSFVANAAVYGNAFQWHVDADPSACPGPAWLAPEYANGEAGRPLLVSLLVYVDEHWRRDWDAETLFLEQGSGVGLLVQPRPGRAVLMHQDALHRVSTPSLTARRPRYSLVWKLLFVPRPGGGGGIGAAGGESICRPEWGEPTRVGGTLSKPAPN